MIKNILETEIRKALLIKNVVNCKLILGVNSTVVRFQEKYKDDKILYSYKNKDGYKVDVYEEITNTVKKNTWFLIKQHRKLFYHFIKNKFIRSTF